MDFAALKDAALDRTGLPSTDGLATPTSLGRAVNAALQKIATEKNWPWLYIEQTATTVAHNAELTLPINTQRICWLAIGEDDLDYRQRRDLVRFDGEEGQPSLYSTYGVSKVVLARKPDQAYSIDMGLVRPEPALVNPADTAALPAQYHDRLVVEAALYIAVKRRDVPLINDLRQEARDWKKNMEDDGVQTKALPRIRTRQDWSL